MLLKFFNYYRLLFLFGFLLHSVIWSFRQAPAFFYILPFDETGAFDESCDGDSEDNAGAEMISESETDMQTT